MNLLTLREKMPHSEDNFTNTLSRNENAEEFSIHDDYAIINMISFEKSFSRLKNNYVVPSKLNSLDAFDHHQ